MTQLTLSLRSRNYALDAQQFIDANPEFWFALTDAALDHHAAHRRFSVKRFVEDWRYDGPLTEAGKPYRISNNLAAPFADLLCEAYPQLDGVTIIRRSTYRR